VSERRARALTRAAWNLAFGAAVILAWEYLGWVPVVIVGAVYTAICIDQRRPSLSQLTADQICEREYLATAVEEASRRARDDDLGAIIRAVTDDEGRAL
jgi:hypothetical protein